MITADTVKKLFARSRNMVILLTLMAMCGAVFYLVPPAVLTIGYAIASLVSGVLLVCMLQSEMLDSSLPFRIALSGLAAGCLASALIPFLHGYEVNSWSFMRAAALACVIGMMRWRQMGGQLDKRCDRVAGLP